ncbi:MAG: HigA family addiction module antidote protein [Treponema sp.]|nr:HigA family addiction module antidote protein [Treponema sp.]
MVKNCFFCWQKTVLTDEVLPEHRSITANTAIRFSKFFGTTSEFWLNLQNLYDLEEENNHAPEFETIKTYAYA